MKKKLRTIISLVLVLAMSLAMSVPSFAAEKPARHSSIVSSYPETPGGVLSQEEILKRQENVSTRAGSSQTYQYIDVTETYDGERDRGIVMKGSNNRQGTGTDSCTFSKSFTVSNSASIAAGFSRNDVEAKVGFSTTWSDTRTFSYTAQLRRGESVNIHYKDLYHVNKLDFTTVTKWWDGSSVTPRETTKKAKGWAEQWYAPYLWAD